MDEHKTFLARKPEKGWRQNADREIGRRNPKCQTSSVCTTTFRERISSKTRTSHETIVLRLLLQFGRKLLDKRRGPTRPSIQVSNVPTLGSGMWIRQRISSCKDGGLGNLNLLQVCDESVLFLNSVTYASTAYSCQTLALSPEFGIAHGWIFPAAQDIAFNMEYQLYE